MNVVQSPKGWNFDKGSHRGKLYPHAHLADKGQIVRIESISGLGETLIQEESDFFYYVLSGNGSFSIDGKEESCSESDLVVIPAGIPYTFSGSMGLLLFSAPAWRAEQEKTA